MEHLNERLAQRTSELAAGNNKIEMLNKRVQELDNERLAAETKAADTNNMNRELNKAVQRTKDSLSKKEQVRHSSRIGNEECADLNISCVLFCRS